MSRERATAWAVLVGLGLLFALNMSGRLMFPCGAGEFRVLRARAAALEAKQAALRAEYNARHRQLTAAHGSQLPEAELRRLFLLDLSDTEAVELAHLWVRIADLQGHRYIRPTFDDGDGEQEQDSPATAEP